MTGISSAKIHHRLSALRAFQQPCSLAIGSFDGVHLGHQAIVEQVVAYAQDRGLESRLLTFYPRPSEYFAEDKTLPSLMSWREKVSFLANLGLDDVICMPFNRSLSELSPKDFIEQILVQGLKAEYLTVGSDFRFGAKKGGDPKLLESLSSDFGYQLGIASTKTFEGSRISSTSIREALLDGNMELAERLLGRSYRLCGRVIRGKQLGRQLGAPTANVHLKRRRLCVNGVYVAKAWVQGLSYDAIANVGVRPAVDNLEKPLLEVHLLDYDRDLYGQQLEVDLLHKIRSEKKFDSLAILQRQIGEDIAEAKRWHIQNK